MILRSLLTCALALTATSAHAQLKPGRTPMAPPPDAVAPTPPAPPPAPTVGGVAMLPTRTIAENAALAPTLTTLVTAVKAAGLDGALAASGTMTVFAPTNDAFGRLAPGTVDTLLKPENKATLARILTYHVVPGTITAADLQKRIADGGGTATLTTTAGATLAVTLTGAAVTLTDASGNKSYIEQPDVTQANGVVHVVNGVLVPKLS